MIESGEQMGAWGDVTGKELDPKGVWKARKLEMEFFRKIRCTER